MRSFYTLCTQNALKYKIRVDINNGTFHINHVPDYYYLRLAARCSVDMKHSKRVPYLFSFK